MKSYILAPFWWEVSGRGECGGQSGEAFVVFLGGREAIFELGVS